MVAAAGATAHRVGVLSPTAARALAGEVLAVPAATLPPAADRAFAAVGHVPLAVALLAAAVRSRQVWEQATDESGHNELPDQVAEPGGPSWEEIAADLARDADVYGTHPYATTFRALHIAVAALPADLRSALLGLAVFPPDSAIPVAAIARYWAHTRDRSAEEAAADLDRLVAAEVLQRDGGDTIGFHDLAHEYLLLHADALPGLHALLLDAYRGLLDEPDQWWTLPVGEPYVWEHLAGHLAGAGDRDTLVATVVNPGYQAQRIAATARTRARRTSPSPPACCPRIPRSRGGGRGSAGTATWSAGVSERTLSWRGPPRRCSPGWRPTRHGRPKFGRTAWRRSCRSHTWPYTAVCVPSRVP